MGLIDIALKAAGLTTEDEFLEAYIEFKKFVKAGDKASEAMLDKKIKAVEECMATNADSTNDTLLQALAKATPVRKYFGLPPLP